MTTSAGTGHKGSARNRAARAVESFRSVSEALGPIERGMAVFAVTRGQWSMLDAILYTLDQLGPSAVSVWAWTIANYDVDILTRLRRDKRIEAGRLVIDQAYLSKEARNHRITGEWRKTFGPESVRYVFNHAKMATVKSASGFRCLLRGSMNLNYNPRFEQFDITEGGEDFDLVERIELSLPVLPDDASRAEGYAKSQLGEAFSAAELPAFGGLKKWKP